MENYYDLVVVGAGPGGLSAAKRSAQYGVRVAIAEQHHLGGVCVNQGCIPKKLMVYASDSAQLINNLTAYGWCVGESRFDWQKLLAALNQEIRRLQEVQRRSLLDAGIDIIQGEAQFLDPHQLQIGDRIITADRVVIAVGGKPIRPKAIAGIEQAVTSDAMFQLDSLPQNLVILGGGYIGVEFASILRGLGSQVTIINIEDGILNGFDDDLRHAVQRGLEQRGIQFHTNTTAKRIDKMQNGFQLTLDGEQCPATLMADLILCATGRQPNLDHIGLVQAGVAVQEGAIAVDEFNRTSQSHIFAIGDCVARQPLTPVAREEGHAVAETLFGKTARTVDYHLIPSAVFSRPEAATVGMTEAQARDNFGDAVDCWRIEFQPLFHSLSDRSEKMLMKILSDRQSQRILGIHIVGENAAEMIQGLTTAIRKGITYEDLATTIGIHPSSAEELFTVSP